MSYSCRTPGRAAQDGVPQRIDREVVLPAELEDLRIPDRFSRFAVVSAWEAARLAASCMPPGAPLACIFSTTFNTRASVEAWLSSLLTRPNPLLFPSATSAVTIGHIARALAIRRSVTVLNSTSPLPMALRWLAMGREQFVLVVATDELEGSAPAALARQEPRTRFIEATAAMLIAADAPMYADRPAVTAWATAALTSDSDISGADGAGALGDAMAQLRTVFGPGGSSWGLCSAGTHGELLSGEIGAFGEILQPRESIGDALGASSLVAVSAVLDRAVSSPVRRWIVNDLDRAGGALSLCLELP